MSGDKPNYVKVGEASEHFGVCIQTLRRWTDARDDRIQYKVGAGKHRLINIEAREHSVKDPEAEKIFYCIVSSTKQKDDLERQIKLSQEQLHVRECWRLDTVELIRYGDELDRC